MHRYLSIAKVRFQAAKQSAMPPKKKKRKAAPKESEEPSDFVTYTREKGQKRFATGKNAILDVDQNVREIRALLTINAEIFGRVYVHASKCTYLGDSVVRLRRCGFEHVIVRSNGEFVDFTTEVVSSIKHFDIEDLKCLPADLEGFFVVKYQTCSIGDLVDYSIFFESALLLHDDVLEPFLVKLKYHLESIHVSLGEMESWLLEVQSKIEFIESTFNMKLETPTHDREGEEWDLITFEETGEFGKIFDIDSESERAKLKKLLEYMKS